jgi:protein-tyrosine phosphatase
MLDNLHEIINDRYGSRRGILMHAVTKAACHAGYYQHCKKFKWTAIKRLVFVCSGNICRSALAEQVALAQGYPAISYGLDCRGGDPADPRTIAFAEAHGFIMAHHLSRRIHQDSIQNGDLLVFMEPKHLSQFLKPDPPCPMTLLGLWYEPRTPYIHDPFMANPAYFERCCDLIVRATINMISVSRDEAKRISGRR